MRIDFLRDDVAVEQDATGAVLSVNGVYAAHLIASDGNPATAEALLNKMVKATVASHTRAAQAPSYNWEGGA